MELELFLFAIGLVILGYLGFVFLFPKAIPDESSSRTRNALRELMDTSRASEAATGDNIDSILKEEFQEETALVRGFYSLPLLKDLYKLQVQAGHQSQSLLIMGIIIALLFLLTAFFLFGGVGPLSIPLALLLTYLLPKKYFKRKVKKRNTHFINMFPDVLDMIVRSVRSGFPITTAFKMVAENMEYPVKQEFQQVVSEIAAGRSINETLNRLAARINEPDINFFVVVLSVQQETGGNLAEVVSNLSGIIRKRKQLRMKIRAMTSEGRATGMILGSLPVVVFGILYFIRREYLKPLWLDPLGQFILGGAILLVAGCMWIVNQMIDIDI